MRKFGKENQRMPVKIYLKAYILGEYFKIQLNLTTKMSHDFGEKIHSEQNCGQEEEPQDKVASLLFLYRDIINFTLFKHILAVALWYVFFL